VSPMASSSSLRLGLRSSNTAKYVKHTTRTKLGERALSYAGLAAWNALPATTRHYRHQYRVVQKKLYPCFNFAITSVNVHRF